MAQFVERRRRELEDFGREAEAAAYEAYRKAIRAGENLQLSTPGQVMAYGARLLRGAKPQPASGSGTVLPKSREPDGVRPATSQPPAVRPTGQTQTAQGGGWLDRSPTAKGFGGDVARGVGNVAGLASGAWHAVEGLGEGAVFLSRFLNPLDELISPPGESASDQLADAARGAINYAKNGVSDPRSVARDIRNKAHQVRVDIDPGATPPASTFSGELRRNFGIGQNQGELAFDVGSLAVGGPLAKGVGKLGAVSKGGSAAKYLDQGFRPEVAAHLAAPYEGMGHHFGPRRRNLPSAYSESVFNVLKPKGMTRGDFYELHYHVDPLFNHARLPARLGGGSWRGKDLGFEKYGLPGRIWYGSPAPLKARVGGLTAATGGLIYDYPNEEP
jgi:hypothetical protein